MPTFRAAKFNDVADFSRGEPVDVREEERRGQVGSAAVERVADAAEKPGRGSLECAVG